MGHADLVNKLKKKKIENLQLIECVFLMHGVWTILLGEVSHPRCNKCVPEMRYPYNAPKKQNHDSSTDNRRQLETE